MKKSMKENIAAILTTVVVLVAIWFGIDAFIGLVIAIYAFLDLYIWAFFAGIIAFFFAITIVALMIKIGLVLIFLTMTGLILIASVIVDIFSKKERK